MKLRYEHLKKKEKNWRWWLSYLWYEKNFLFISIESPQIEDISPTITVRDGTNVTLFCVVRGDPHPDVQWTYKNNSNDINKLSSDSNIQNNIINNTNIQSNNIPNYTSSPDNNHSSIVVESRLTFCNVSFATHHGIYTCSGRNRFGISEKDIQLNIHGMLRFLLLYFFSYEIT